MRTFDEQSVRRIGNAVRAVERNGGGTVVRRGKFDDIGGDAFDGELWVNGYHLYDDTNFSPDNTNGGTIGGTYSGAEWIESDLSGSNPSASYSATGPSSASWDANKAWVKLSEAGGAGRYVYHLPSGARQSDLLRWDATNSHWIKLTGPDADGKKYVLMADNGVLSWVEAEEMTCT